MYMKCVYKFRTHTLSCTYRVCAERMPFVQTHQLALHDSRKERLQGPFGCICVLEEHQLCTGTASVFIYLHKVKILNY